MRWKSTLGGLIGMVLALVAALVISPTQQRASLIDTDAAQGITALILDAKTAPATGPDWTAGGTRALETLRNSFSGTTPHALAGAASVVWEEGMTALVCSSPAAGDRKRFDTAGTAVVADHRMIIQKENVAISALAVAGFAGSRFTDYAALRISPARTPLLVGQTALRC